MEEKLQNRQDLIDAIIPTTFPVGCRRPTPGTGFLEALVDPKTKLLTGAIASVDKTGINRANGEHIDVDVIVCCTGSVCAGPLPREKILTRRKDLTTRSDQDFLSTFAVSTCKNSSGNLRKLLIWDLQHVSIPFLEGIDARMRRHPLPTTLQTVFLFLFSGDKAS